jgi:hypothetical protein
MEKRHQAGLENLVIRLLDKPNDAVLMNVPYKTSEYNGELDVVRIRGERATIYEVKLHDTFRKYEYAKEQLHRVQKAFPNWKVNLVYYPLNGKPERIR